MKKLTEDETVDLMADLVVLLRNKGLGPEVAVGVLLATGINLGEIVTNLADVQEMFNSLVQMSKEGRLIGQRPAKEDMTAKVNLDGGLN